MNDLINSKLAFGISGECFIAGPNQWSLEDA